MEQTMTEYFGNAKQRLEKHYTHGNMTENLDAMLDVTRVYTEIVSENPDAMIANGFNFRPVVFDQLKRVGFLSFDSTNAGGSCYMPEIAIENRAAIIAVSEKFYNEYETEAYDLIIRHEFAHAECNMRYDGNIYADGEEEFNEIVDEFGGIRTPKHLVQESAKNGYDNVLESMADSHDITVDELLMKLAPDVEYKIAPEAEYKSVEYTGTATVKYSDD